MLATLSELKSYLGITDNSQDTLLTIFLNSAIGTVEASTGRSLELDATDRTEILDGKGHALFLSKYPVSTFMKLENNTGTANVPAWADVSLDGYFVEKPTGIVDVSPSFRGFGEYRATYRGGYAIGSNEHSELKLCVLRIASARYLRKGSDNVRSESVNGDSLTYEASDVSQETETILNRYRRPYVS